MLDRGGRVHQPQPHGRVVLDAGILVLEPAIPPALAFLEEADCRARDASLRFLVSPRSDQALAGRLQVLDQPQYRRGVAIEPAADSEDRAGDGRVVLADRSVLPEIITTLMLEPFA